MITADTITDEQILALRNELAPVATPRPRAERTAEDLAIIDTCDHALHDSPYAVDYPTGERRLKARARCAEILEARKAGAK